MCHHCFVIGKAIPVYITRKNNNKKSRGRVIGHELECRRKYSRSRRYPRGCFPSVTANAACEVQSIAHLLYYSSCSFIFAGARENNVPPRKKSHTLTHTYLHIA